MWRNYTLTQITFLRHVVAQIITLLYAFMIYIYIYSNTERMSIRLVTVPLTIEEKKTTKKVEIYNPSGGFRALENAITILIH